MKKASAFGLRCPVCGTPVSFQPGKPLPPGFPFCSVRCKMLDLHNWLNEEYVLERELTPVETRRYVERDGEDDEESDL